MAAKKVAAQADNSSLIEMQLVRALRNVPSGEASNTVERVITFLDRETTLIRDVVNTTIGPTATLGPTLYRFFWDIAVWRFTNGYGMSGWTTFLDETVKVAKHAAGAKGQPGGNLVAFDGSGSKTLGLGKPDLVDVCSLIKSDYYATREPRKQPEAQLVAGYEHSHVEPFHTHGNGPTIPEPMHDNRARGAAPMDTGDADAAGN